MNSNYFFTETQRFRQWWLLLLLALSNGVFIYGFWKQVIQGQPFGDNPMSNEALIAACVVMLLLGVMLLASRLETRINSDCIEVRLFPFMWRYKHISWSQIETAEVRKYKPILEYGGWGIRGLGRNRALNMKGNMGLQLVFRDGRRLLIGTSVPDELRNKLALNGKPH